LRKSVELYTQKKDFFNSFYGFIRGRRSAIKHIRKFGNIEKVKLKETVDFRLEMANSI